MKITIDLQLQMFDQRKLRSTPRDRVVTPSRMFPQVTGKVQVGLEWRGGGYICIFGATLLKFRTFRRPPDVPPAGKVV